MVQLYHINWPGKSGHLNNQETFCWSQDIHNTQVPLYIHIHLHVNVCIHTCRYTLYVCIFLCRTILFDMQWKSIYWLSITQSSANAFSKGMYVCTYMCVCVCVCVYVCYVCMYVCIVCVCMHPCMHILCILPANSIINIDWLLLGSISLTFLFLVNTYIYITYGRTFERGKLSWFSQCLSQSQIFSHKLWPCLLAI